jgi:large subunit ribosomal protein L5
MTTKTEQNKRDRAVRDVIDKIVINAGVGRASQQPNFEDKTLKDIKRDLAVISGQEPQLRPAKKSIAGFKIRENQIVGLKVTLRDRKMVDFFERLITIVMPRVHDFRGINLIAVDQGGALNIGFREQFVFPEINPEESLFTFPLGVNIVPRQKDREAAIAAYRSLGVPLKKEGDTSEDLNTKSRKRKTVKR